MGNPYNYEKSTAWPAKLLGKNDKIIPIDYGYTEEGYALTLDMVEFFTMKGYAYKAQSDITVLKSGGVGDFLFEPNGDEIIVARRFIDITSENVIDAETFVYSNPVVTDKGEEVSLFDLNLANTVNDINAKLYKSPSGVDISSSTVLPFGRKSKVDKNQVAHTEDNIFYIMNPNDTYLFRIVNNGSVSDDLVRLDWVFIKRKAWL